jgi:hypothetical protein
VSSITIVSNAPNCGITYDHHYDDCNSFIIQATGQLKSSTKSHHGLGEIVEQKCSVKVKSSTDIASGSEKLLIKPVIGHVKLSTKTGLGQVRSSTTIAM